MSVYAAALLALPCCGDDDDDSTGDTASETTGAGDSQGADCGEVGLTQPCSCRTTVVAVGTQTCGEDGWGACECPSACVEAQAVNNWCPNDPRDLAVDPSATEESCARGIAFGECACVKFPLTVGGARLCGLSVPTDLPDDTIIRGGDTTGGDETTGE